MSGGFELIDYDVYEMTKQERTKYIILAAVGLFALGYIFFNTSLLAAPLAILSFWYPRFKTNELILKRKSALNAQFKDALYALSSALGVGRSLESSFKIVLNDLRVLYPDQDTYITREFEYICRRIDLNIPVEHVLLDFGNRAGLEDIRNFAEVVSICKKSGGNLVQVVKNTSNIISDKIEVVSDIEVLLSKQKFEQKVLNVMPFVFIALIKFGGSGYMDVLYSSPQGYIFMFIALLILGLSYFVSKKILDIKV